MCTALICSRLPVYSSIQEACFKANYDCAGFERGFASGDMEEVCVCVYAGVCPVPGDRLPETRKINK